MIKNDIKKTLTVLMVLVLMVSLTSLALADEVEETTEDEVESFEETQEGENETEDPEENESEEPEPEGNETEEPEENESEEPEPEGNETEEPEGNETEDPDGNETEDPVGNETEEEIQIMNNSLGAEIRLLQLEKAILKNLLKGERAVEVLKAMGYNTTELEAILAEMRLLLEEVQAADPTAAEAVQQFVDLKSDARKLTKQFRDAVKDMLSDSKIKELKAQIGEIVGEQLQNYSKKIQNQIKQFNRNQIHRLYVFFGEEQNNSLVTAYEDGNATIKQVKSQINKMVNKMTKEKQHQVFCDLKEDKIKNKINAKVSVDDAEEGFEEREQTRLNNRYKKAEEVEDTNLQQQVNKKIKNKSNIGNVPSNSTNNGNSKGNQNN